MTKKTVIQLSSTIPEALAGMRLDQALAQVFPEYSRSRLQEWIKLNQVLVNHKALRTRDKVWGGEQIVISAKLPEQAVTWQAEAIQLNIIHEDDAVLIINKPSGLVVHPGAGNWEGTLVNAILHHAPESAKLPRAGLIHRLDKNTSGLLVIAKTLTAHTSLTQQLQARTMKREYEAVVNGSIIAGRTIDAAIGRDAHQRKKMAINEFGKPAITHFRVIERFRAHTHIQVKLETGRTHQIRVHMAHIHHAVLGDVAYGGRLQLPRGASPELIEVLRQFKRQALHARTLGFIHPQTQQEIAWSAPLPEDMQSLLAVLKLDN